MCNFGIGTKLVLHGYIITFEHIQIFILILKKKILMYSWKAYIKDSFNFFIYGEKW